jgi:hypothetical protein
MPNPVIMSSSSSCSSKTVYAAFGSPEGRCLAALAAFVDGNEECIKELFPNVR